MVLLSALSLVIVSYHNAEMHWQVYIEARSRHPDYCQEPLDFWYAQQSELCHHRDRIYKAHVKSHMAGQHSLGAELL